MDKYIIKDRQIVKDGWTTVTDEDALPTEGHIIVSYKRWQQDKEKLKQFNDRLGVILDTGVSIKAIIDDLEHFQLVAIQFAEFKDGRGYSQARLLRERFTFDGELRAMGNVLRDQIFYLHRCGFDAFELEPGRDIHEAVQAFNDFTVSYQPAYAYTTCNQN